LLKTAQDLTAAQLHQSALASQGCPDTWKSEKAEREVNGRVDGQIVFGMATLILTAARAGFCLAYPTEERVLEDLTSGRLVRVPAVFG
jgi:DNA-binding transcriptional LysR family regulator